MPTATGYGFRKKITLSNSSLTDYVSAPEDGIIVNSGAGTDSAADVYLGGNAQDSFIDVVLTDTSDNIIPFEWAYRKPGDYGKLIWSKASVAANQELYLYYGKASAVYEGADVGTFVERWQDYANEPLTNDSHDDVTRSHSVALGQRATSAEADGFLYVAWSQDRSNNNPDIWIGQYDLFTRSFVARWKLGEAFDDDPHAHGSVLVDSSGHIHVWVPRPDHASGAQHWKSTNPHDVTAWGSASSIGATNQHDGGYYFQPVLRPNGDIWLFFRDRDFWYISSTDDGATWSSATSVISEDTAATPASDERVYGWISVDSDTDDILISYSHADAVGGYENLGFIHFDHSATAWKAADGTTITLPAIPTDDTLVEDSSGAERMTNGFGPFITAAGEFAFFYAHNGNFGGTDIRLKRWNGSTWSEDTISITDINGPGVIAWEDGSTKHIVARIRVSATRYDWREFTASTWGGTWTGGTYIFQNEGTLTDIEIPNQRATGIPIIVAVDQDSDNIWWRDPDGPSYTHTWSEAGSSTALAGAGYCRVIADQASSRLQHALSTVHSSARMDFNVLYSDVGSTSAWNCVFGLYENLEGYAVAGNDVIGMVHSESPSSISQRPTIHDNTSFFSGSNLEEGQTPVDHWWESLSWDGSTVIGKRWTKRDHATADGSESSTHAMATSLDNLGFSHAVSGTTNSAISSKYYLGQIRYYEDQTASAPTYSTWGIEETAPFGGGTEEASVSFAVSADADYTALATAEGSASFAGSVDVTKSATATALGSITFPVSVDATTTAQADQAAFSAYGVSVDSALSADAQAEGATAQGLSVAAAMSGLATAEGAVTPGAQAGYTVTGEAIADSEAAMAVDVHVADQYTAQAIANAVTVSAASVGYTPTAQADADAAIAQAVTAGQVFTAQITAEVAITPAVGAGFTVTGEAVSGGAVEASVTVAQNVTVTAVAEGQATASVAITQEMATSLVVEVAAQAGVSVGAVTNVLFDGTSISGQITTPGGRTFTVSARIKTITIAAEPRTLIIN